MVRQIWAHGAKAQRRLRWRTRMWWRGAFRVRAALPWALATGLNAVLVIALVAMPLARAPRGLPDGQSVVPVVVVAAIPVAPEPEPPAPEPPPERPPPEVVIPIDVSTVATTAPTPEPEVPSTPAAAVPESNGTGFKLPEVSLPSADAGAGARNGLVALSCNDQFADPEKAAECAGREIRSGWRPNVAELGPEWAEIAEQLRRGGVSVPAYGPDELGGLRANQRIFAPQDPRFRQREFDQWGRYTRSFNSPREYQQYQNLRDHRRYVGEGGAVVSGYGISESVPISGWQPSWQLRDDPNVDRRELDALVREANENAERGQE